MKRDFLFFFIAASLVLYVSVSSCDDPRNGKPGEGPYYHAPAGQKTIFEPTAPIDYGNGVYYFDDAGKQFGISLSAFLADTSKHLVSVTYESFSVGYWVVVKEK